jgi:hypothetical protein
METLISVVATTMDGTRAALLAAKQAAQDRKARVALIVPRVPSGAPSGQRFMDATNWLVARYEQVARDVDQPVQLRVCAAPDAATAAALLSPAGGIVFIGGPSGWLWPSPERRLAAKLRRRGREVVFVGCNRE